MRQSTHSLASETGKQTTPTDTADLPKPSAWDVCLLELQLVGLFLAVLFLLWGIHYLQNR
jgi:hypothetical protein